MIECFRKQQSLNLLSRKHVNDINISASPHRTLNSSRGFIRYRDDDHYLPGTSFNCFFYDKWRNLVKGFGLDVRTINRDQFATSNSSSIIFFFILEDVGFWFWFRYNKEGSIKNN
jgi:hypothetical protein